MPTAWINTLPKSQLEVFASQLGLPTDGTLDELRRTVREKWVLVEACLPAPVGGRPLPVADQGPPGSQEQDLAGREMRKVRVKLVTDLVLIELGSGSGFKFFNRGEPDL
jgi:hypothetical protein